MSRVVGLVRRRQTRAVVCDAHTCHMRPACGALCVCACGCRPDVQFPWYSLMVLGCYALLCLGIDFMHFTDCTEASKELAGVRSRAAHRLHATPLPGAPAARSGGIAPAACSRGCHAHV